MMKKLCFSFCLIIIVSMLATVFVGASEAKLIDEVIIYVSPNGDDSGDGTIDNMLKTPAGVQEFIKKSGLLKKKPIRVVFKDGDYFIDKGIKLGIEDAGSPECPVIWEAETKGKVRFLGSTVLDNSLFVPVTDENILRRIPESARDKVMQLDLSQMAIEMNENQAHLWSNKTFKQPYTDLIRNGKKEMLSRWPNGINNYAKWDKVLIPGTSGVLGARGVEYGPKILFDNPRILRWTEAKNAYITGHVSTTYSIDFLEVHSVDINTGTIQLMTSPQYGLADSSPRELQIFNLIEELDIPSEWYIDASSQILYYYPPDKMDSNMHLELITLNDNMFVLEDDIQLYYTFRNIEFSRCRRYIMEARSDNVTIDGCTFTYSKGLSALYASGNEFLIENCVIAHHDGRGVSLGGRDQLTNTIRTKSYFRNNYIYDVGEMVNSVGHAIYVEGVNIDVLNNTVHYVPQGVVFGGQDTNDWKVIGNEFYNFGLNLSDVGGFYYGYSGSTLGSEIAYNYMYDFHPANPNIGTAVQGVYFDDGAHYGYVHHNIFRNGAHAAIQIGGGKYNRAIGNIILDMDVLAFQTDNRVETWANGQQIASQTHSQSNTRISQVPRYSRIYPWTNILNESSPLAPYGNVIMNNITDSSLSMNSRMVELGRVKDNYKLSDYSHFVDPENGNYTLKDTSVFAKTVPELTESEFDINSVGCDLEVTEKIDSSFALSAPLNGVEYDSKSNSFVWQSATMADGYRIVIATDKAMENVVFEDEVYYNYCDVTGLEDGKEYWWYVEAINNSFKRKKIWKSDVESFINKELHDVAIENLFFKLSTTEYVLESADLTQYEDGAPERFRLVCDQVRDFYEEAMITQDVTEEEIAEQIKKLNDAVDVFNKSEKIFYTKFDPKYLDPDMWYLNGNDAKVVDNTLVLNRPESATSNYAILKEHPNLNDVFAFKAKIDYLEPTGGWISFELRRGDTAKAAWNDRGVMVIIKREQIELQAYPGGGVIKVVENKWVKDDEWHEYAVGVISKADSNRYIFTIDGEVVINHIDYNKYIVEPGYFGSSLHTACELTIAPSEMDYDNNKMKEGYYFVGQSSYTETGMWSVAEQKGESNSEVRKSSSKDSSASWEISELNGNKKLYFRKVTSNDGDKTAKIIIESNYILGREGDENIKEITIDFTTNDDEWILLDTANYDGGKVSVTLTGSGEGSLYANSLWVENVQD